MSVTYYFADSYSPTAPTSLTGTQPEWEVAMSDAGVPAVNII